MRKLLPFLYVGITLKSEERGLETVCPAGRVQRGVWMVKRPSPWGRERHWRRSHSRWRWQRERRWGWRWWCCPTSSSPAPSSPRPPAAGRPAEPPPPSPETPAAAGTPLGSASLWPESGSGRHEGSNTECAIMWLMQWMEGEKYNTNTKL